jgi:hypothetical protein
LPDVGSRYANVKEATAEWRAFDHDGHPAVRRTDRVRAAASR